MGGGPLAIGMLSDALQPTWHAESLRWALVSVAMTGGAVAVILGVLATWKLQDSIRLPNAAVPSAVRAPTAVTAAGPDPGGEA